MSILFPEKEKDIEKRCCNIARDDGWKVRKNSSPHRRAALDHHFLKAGRHVDIEFKRPGCKPTDLQQDEIDDIIAHGGEAYWTDNVLEFKRILGVK